MDVFDLLDRETHRFSRDFRACSAERDEPERHSRGESLLRRVATYLLALEDVVYPSLVAADLRVSPAVLQAHERVHRRTAEALLRHCGKHAGASRSLGRVRYELTQYIEMMRRELYPQMYRSLCAAESLLLADELLQWLASHRRRHEDAAAVSESGHWSPSQPAGLDLDRLPTLHHVVAVQPRPGNTPRSAR